MSTWYISMRSRIFSSFEQHGFRNLFYSLLLYDMINPFLGPFPSLAFLSHLLLCFCLFLAVYAIQTNHVHRVLAVSLLIPLLLVYWMSVYDLPLFSRGVAYLFLAAYYGLLIYSFTRQIVRFGKVTLQTLYAALCLYLIIGQFWGVLYALLYKISPGAYSGALLENAGRNTLEIFNYFSMVTLTTLGYGDITPQTAGAGALCRVEAVVGQFFTAVVVGWMVGNVVSEKKRVNDSDE